MENKQSDQKLKWWEWLLIALAATGATDIIVTIIKIAMK